MSGVVVEALGESAWLLRLGEQVDVAVNRQVHALARRLRTQAPDWLGDLVPAYASLAVLLAEPDRASREAARAWLEQALTDIDATAEEPGGREVVIPVCYDPPHGPDLEATADALDLDPGAVVERHLAPHYQVAMIGFAPGFPYLLGLDPALSLPRLERPRERVPAGSVGIGGGQTGIYPAAGPGGWRLLGRTPLRLFDPGWPSPTRLEPGDRVRLVRIDADRFDALRTAEGGLDAD